MEKKMTDTQKILEALQSGNFNFNQLIQLDEFKWVLKSILDTGEQEEWKADLIEFINSDSSDNSSTFFYNMLPFVRFVNEPANDSAAYTAPDHRIYMNAPKGFGIGTAEYKWEFIYYHECLHQLWDTFDVEKNIVKQFGSCDHEILNIASDCVINDFLHVNKKMPYPTDGLVTPEFIKDHYGVEYERKKDTQFGLYEKLMKVADQIKKDAPPEQPGGTIKPGKINKVPSPPGGGGGPDQNFPPEFVKGWTDAIKDVLNKKVDPLTYTPKTPTNLYDQGYNAAMDKIRKGITDGIDVPVSQGGDGGKPPKSNLPEIPWEKPAMPKPQGGQGQSGKGGKGGKQDQQQQDPANDAQKSANDAQQAADEAELSAAEAQTGNDKASSNRASSAASKARQAAQDAQDAADKAKDAAARGDSSTAKREAGRAQKKADEARQAADAAREEANKSNGKGDGADAAASAQQASDVAEHASDRADSIASSSGSAKAKAAAAKAKKAAQEARDAADKAMEAAMDGNDELAKKEAKKAIEKAKEATEAANQAQAEADKARGESNKGKEGKSSSNDQAGPGGYQHEYNGWKDLDEPTSEYWKKLGDDEIKRFSGRISGAFGEFVRKCKLSETEEKKEGVVVRARKSAAWNKALEKKVDAYVYQRVINKRRETEPTYSRIKRGSRPIKFGEPIQPGTKIKDDKLNINVAFYIDRSGSMGQDSVESCFSLAYQISDRLRKEYKSEKVVGEIGMKYFAFNSYMEEIPRGRTVSCGGTTMSVKEILEFIESNTGEYLINIIITDLETDINKSAVTALVKKMPGMFFIISNQAQHEQECRDIERACKGKFAFIQSNADWTLA